MGCAALGLCYVAAGMWDAYQIDYLYPWDYAGGSIIVQEANGVVLDTNGRHNKCFHDLNMLSLFFKGIPIANFLKSSLYTNIYMQNTHPKISITIKLKKFNFAWWVLPW